MFAVLREPCEFFASFQRERNQPGVVEVIYLGQNSFFCGLPSFFINSKRCCCESSHQRDSSKKDVLKNFADVIENTCVGL